MKTMKLRKQIKDLGIKKIEKVLKEGGFLTAGQFTLDFDMTTHDQGMRHFESPRGMFFVSHWAIVAKFEGIEQALENFSQKMENRTKLKLFAKQPQFKLV
tara:strand:- start:7858 stop:8157 length:300 start_codon:yes stop_codon:yes gene_type:complete